MTGRKLLVSVLFFLLLLSFQVLIGRNLTLFGTAFCFVYVGTILFLPIETPSALVLLLGLFTGLFVDFFYNSLGMHAAACVFIAFIRRFVLNFLKPDGGYEDYMEIATVYMGLRWMLLYLTPLVLIHSVLVFLIEYGGLVYFFEIMLDALASTVLNVFLLVLIQYAIYWPSSKSL